MVHLTRAKNVREVGPMRHRHQGEQGGEVRNAGAEVALSCIFSRAHGGARQREDERKKCSR